MTGASTLSAMDNLWTRNERPIPASYWVAAGFGSLVILICYATATWVPWFIRDWGSWFGPQMYAFGPGLLALFGGSIGLVAASVPWLALRWPGLGIGLALLPLLATFIDPQDLALHFGVFASLCTVVLTSSWRDARAAVVAAATAVLVVVGWLVSGRHMAAPFRADISLQNYGGSRLLLGLAYAAAVGLVGLVAWQMRRSGLRDVERRALSARSGEVEEQAAVVGERARLARDLHDVVAHHVSLIAVRAETAPYTHPTIGEEARGVLGDIAADARLALDELRGVLGILGRSGAAERAPQPTWSDISALVERTRSAGVEVEMLGDATADVGAGAGYTAYRVVQEALTNARKHAPGARVVVDLEATSHLLTVTVSTPLPEGARTQPAGGQGLVGMRERVEALGGRLLAGPVNDEFVVEAILPRTAAVGVA
jgi:signal transduction histidine kinase